MILSAAFFAALAANRQVPFNPSQTLAGTESKLFSSVAALPGQLSPRQSSTFVPKPGYFPATGDDTVAGGIFCFSLTDLAAYIARVGNNPAATGTESPKGNAAATSGSGPYPAQTFTDSKLKKHTIFAPKTPPANVTMPIIVWGNGGCGTDPMATHANILLEIASHGYVIAADGIAGGNTGASQSMVSDMKASLELGNGWRRSQVRLGEHECHRGVGSQLRRTRVHVDCISR